MGHRPVHKVSPLRRLFCIPPISLALLAGLAPFVDAGSFTSPLFEPIRDLAPLKVWGSVWLLAALLGIHGAYRGAWETYIAAHILLAALSTLWLATLLYARWWLGIPLTLTAIGLWAYPLLQSLLSVAVPVSVVEVSRDVARRSG